MTANAELVEAGDLDELLRHVDRLCAASDWEGLEDLRERCLRAVARGRQLWPVAAHAEYRLALEAPGPWAARTLAPGRGRFALGPLAEVAASSHTWAELAPHAPAGPVASIAAHERVVRGEDLRGDERVDPRVLDLPLVLQPWEPPYPVASYKAHEADAGDVAPPPLTVADLPPPPPLVDDPEACRALVELAGAWTAESNGRARAVAVRGDGLSAVGAVAGLEAVRVAPVPSAHALALMAWTAASGGAHGRRRGMAPGRFAAWWAVAALAGALDDWPLPPDEVGEAAGDLRWWRWEPLVPPTGWWLGLAADDPDEGLAWAVEATDHT